MTATLTAATVRQMLDHLAKVHKLTSHIRTMEVNPTTNLLYGEAIRAENGADLIRDVLLRASLLDITVETTNG